MCFIRWGVVWYHLGPKWNLLYKKANFQKKMLQIFFNFYLRHKIRLGVHFWHFQSDLRPLNMRNRLLYVKFGDDRLNSRWNLDQHEIGNIVTRNDSKCTGTSRECLKNIQKALLSVSIHQTSQFVVHIRPNIDFPKKSYISDPFLIH